MQQESDRAALETLISDRGVIDVFTPDQRPGTKAGIAQLLFAQAQALAADGDSGSVDTYGQAVGLREFEREVASTLGMESAVFMVSGVMA